ncbi:MAG: putative Histidine kinase [Candidatus Gallionella acididurans]|uniref:Virulence sensor protein BvgS n=1 Tax=Candidatus Gallionella acididurans TaxID=1796491 RepID=A0A139BYF4_9PROT|nr:MAG: putative Histidine kinase [Candidatus Gallionella acididurans]
MAKQHLFLFDDRPNVAGSALQAEQIRLLYAVLPVSLAVNVLIASILAAVQISVLDVMPIMIWCALFGMAIALRAIISFAYRHTMVNESTSKALLTRFRIGVAATGITWGLASYLLFPVKDIPHQSLLAFAIAGMTAGAITSLSADLVSSLVFIIPALVPLIARLLAVGGEIPLAMGTMSTIYLVALTLNARRTYLVSLENISLRIAAVVREQSATEADNSKGEFPLLRRLSITILAAMLVTAFILILLYRQDQLASFESHASDENEKVLYQLVNTFDKDIAAYVSNAKVNSSTLPNTPDLDSIFAQELKQINKHNILKLKIYNPSGIAIYSSARSEIGKTSQRADLLGRALHGETAHATESRDTFLGTTGEMHDVQLFITYMPIKHSGKQIGVIESYDDASSHFGQLHSKILSISLLVCGVFSALYTALFFAVRKADQSIVVWRKSVERSREFLNKAQSIAHIGSWHYHLATGRLDWSRELYRIYGVSPETFTPSIKDLINLIHPDDQSAMQERIEAWASGKKPEAFEFRCVWHDGSIRNYQGQCELICDAHGKPIHVSGTVQDITERKQSEDTLRLSEEKFSRIFHDSPDAMMITETNTGLIREINQSFTDLFGYSQDEAIGRTITDFGFWFDEDSGKETVSIIKSKGFVRNHEVKHRTKDGRILTLLASTTQLHFGGTISLVVHLRDITGRKQIEDEFMALNANLEQRVRERTAQLQRANLAKDSFLATMSHEIRTPLGGMMGMMELLEMSQLDAKQREILQVARDSGKNLLRIVNDILDWSKIEAGKLGLSPHATSIPDMLKSVTDTHSQIASEKDLHFNVEIDPELSAAHIFDPLRLSQILNNFISNAIKFTQHGNVTISTQRIAHHAGYETVCFSVKDSGSGIDPEHQSRLFQHYEQATADTARMYGGTGLGLAICRRLAELMDGTLSVESTLGVGSTFSLTVSLPVVKDLPQNSRKTDQQPSHTDTALLIKGDAPVAILIVDDHPINRMLLKQQLELLGLQVQVAEDGAKALVLWQNNHFDLIITDCHMPEMDGYELSRHIRELENEADGKHIPIIAWTANVLTEEAVKTQAAGMDDLLTKPTELSELRVTLLKWLPKLLEPLPQRFF